MRRKFPTADKAHAAMAKVMAAGARRLGYKPPPPRPLRNVGRMNAARAALDAMTDDERVEVFGFYCTACGGPPGCYCMRDD